MQGALRNPHPFGEAPGEIGDQIKRGAVEKDEVENVARTVLLGGERTQAERGELSVVLEVQDRAVECDTEGGGVIGLGTRQEHARADNGEKVEKGVRGIDPTRYQDEGCYQDE